MKLNNSLDNLLSLHGYSYYNKLTKIQDIGVIAQEVEKVFPDLVQTNADGYKTVSYGNLVAPVIEAIRELSQKIDNLTASVSELFATYLDQQSQIDALEARLSQLEAK